MDLCSKVSRRAALAVIGVAGMGAALAACGATPTPQVVERVVEVTRMVEGTPQIVTEVVKETVVVEVVKEAPTVAAGPTAITFFGRGTSAQETAYRDLLKAYDEEHDDVTMTVQWVPEQGDLDKSLLLQYAAGTAPDVLITHVYSYHTLARREALLPLGDLMAADAEFDASIYYPVALEGYQINGKQYGVARMITSYILCYNQTLFEEAGLEVPQADWSWDDFLEAATALTAGEGTEKVYGCASMDNYPSTLVATWQRGGDVVNEDRTAYTLNEEPGVAATQWIADLNHVHQVQATATELSGRSDVFQTGKIAMQPNIYPVFPAEGTPYTFNIQHLPHTGLKQVTRTAFDGHSIQAGTKHPQIAWDIVKLLSGTKGAQMMVDLGIRNPTIREIAEGPQSMDPSLGIANITCMVEALNYARSEPVVGDWYSIVKEINSAISSIYGVTKVAPQEALDGAKERIDEMLAADPYSGVKGS